MPSIGPPQQALAYETRRTTMKTYESIEYLSKFLINSNSPLLSKFLLTGSFGTRTN